MKTVLKWLGLGLVMLCAVMGHAQERFPNKQTFYGNVYFHTNFSAVTLTLDDNYFLQVGTTLGGASIWWNPDHAPRGELIVNSSGNVAIGAGGNRFGNALIQLGNAGPYHEVLDIHPDTTPGGVDSTPAGFPQLFGFSKTITFSAGYLDTNSVSQTPRTGMRAETLDQLGTTEHRFYNPSTYTPGATNAYSAGIEQMAIMNWGVRVDGALERRVAYPQSVTTNYTIRFTNALDIVNPISGTVTFSDVIPVTANGLVVTKDVLIYAGIDNRSGLAFPAAWQWLSAVPTSLSSNNFGRLHLESTDTNDSSVIASWSSGTNAVNIDTNASAFIITANITNVWEKSAVIQLCTALKSHGLWTKLFALYPFVGINSTSQKWNLINTSTFPITWNGSPTFTTNGVTGDGTTAYANTGISPATAPWTTSSALLFVWIRGPQAPPDNSVFIGQHFNGSTYTHLSRSSTGIRADGPFCVSGNVVALNLPGDWRGFAGLNRTLSTVSQTYINSATTGGNNGTSASLGTDNIMLMAEDAANFSTINMASAGFGTGFSAADVTTLIADLQSFNNALNR